MQGKSVQERKDIVARGGVSMWDNLYLSCGTQFKMYDVEDLIRFSVLKKTSSGMPSNSNRVQEAKDALQKNPYDLKLIKKLGFLYADDFEFEKAANVMVRGWKRASEFEDRDERFEFLMKVAEVSYRNFQFKQASAVLMDIEEPEDARKKMAYLLLMCHVHAQAGDAPKSLSSFSKAIDAEGFDAAVRIYAISALSLQKVGAFEVGKNALYDKVRKGDNKYKDEDKLIKIERLVNALGKEKKKGQGTSNGPLDELFLIVDGKPSKTMLKGLAALAGILLLVLIYWLEQSSLRKNKIIA